ncbi:unnamed protein product [Sympodiomycopsis kandeliae]
MSSSAEARSSHNSDDLDPFQLPSDEETPSRTPTSTAVTTDNDKHDVVHSASASASSSSPSPSPSSPTHVSGWEEQGDNQSSRPSMTPTQSHQSHQSHTSQASQGNGAQPQSYQPIPAPNIDMSNVTIVDAQKTTDHLGASNFIVYVIRSGNDEAKRRYSEFEALRSALVRLHPTLIIPPIPAKHSLSDYAVKQSKAKEDATIIARRKRMLQSFLRRCASHPALQTSAVLRKFLDGRWSWHEISTTPPITLLPKSNLKAPPLNPADPQASPAYTSLPVPSSSATPLRNANQRYLDSEAFTNRFAAHMSGSLEKTNRRVVRRWGDATGDFAELGAVLNGFSLSESGQLATAIERTGQASDSTFVSIGGLLQDWEQSMTEPLHEYVQFAQVLQKLLKWRHLKALQLELAQDSLDAKKLKLQELERVEAEAKRLERALETGGRGLQGSGSGYRGSSGGKSSVYGGAVESVETPSSNHDGRDHLGGSSEWSNGIDSSDSGPSASQSSRQHHRQTSSLSSSTTSAGSGGGSGYGLFSAIQQTFSSVLDVDPESTRRREISRLREEVLLLDEAVTLSLGDMKTVNEKIQSDLDRFQKIKIKDFKEVLKRSCTMHMEFCKVNLNNWVKAKEEIERIHRNDNNKEAAGEWPSKNMPESSLVKKERERDEM